MATGDYIAVGHAGAPCFALLNHNSGSPTLSGTYTLTGTGNATSYSPSGNHIAVGHAITPRFTLLNHNSGSPTLSGTYNFDGSCLGTSYSPSGNHIAVASASFFTLLNHNSGSPTLSGYYIVGGAGNATSYSPSGNYIAVGRSDITTPYFTLLNHNSGSPTLSGTYTLTGYGGGVSYSPSGNYIAAGHVNTPYFTLLNHNSGSPTLSGTYTLTGDSYGTSYSPSGNYIVVAHYASPYFILLNHNSGSPTLSGTYTLTGLGKGVSYSPSGNHIAVTSTLSPYFTLLNHNSGSPTLSGTYTLTGNGGGVSYSKIIEVTTQAVSSIGATTATGNGTLVSSPAGYVISERGICYNTAGSPTTSDTTVHDHTASTGAYTQSLTGLVGATKYHCKAYCIIAGVTYYGAESDFMTNAASSVSIYNVTSALKYITRSISFSATFGQSISELKTYGKIITSFVIISLLNYASQIKAFLRFSIASISILLSPSKDRESLNSSGSLTYEGYGELGKIMSGEAASCIKKVCCLKSNCTEDESQTSSVVTMCTESGLTICNADSIKSVRVTCDNDSVQLDHEFTAAEDAAVSGFGTWNDDGDVLYSLCCFGTAINLSSGDILVVRSKVRFNKE